VFVDVEQSIIDKVGEPPAKDLGLYEITQNPSDRWKYKTPGLRNVALTAPYMHNGVFSTLDEVVAFYDQGGIPNPALSMLMFPLNLTETEKADLVEFLKSLTGSNVDTLVADAFAAPVGDLTISDPNWANSLTRPLQGESRWRE
jgi:cytochrome c peroxidase